jgi:hypothetical protein
MEVSFTLEQEEQLAQLALQKGTDAANLVKDAALRLLSDSGPGSSEKVETDPYFEQMLHL